MVKAAKVELVSMEKTGGGYVTAVVRGDVAAVKAAVDAGVRGRREGRRGRRHPRHRRPHVNIDLVLPLGRQDQARPAANPTSNRAEVAAVHLGSGRRDSGRQRKEPSWRGSSWSCASSTWTDRDRGYVVAADAVGAGVRGRPLRHGQSARQTELTRDRPGRRRGHGDRRLVGRGRRGAIPQGPAGSEPDSDAERTEIQAIIERVSQRPGRRGGAAPALRGDEPPWRSRRARRRASTRHRRRGGRRGAAFDGFREQDSNDARRSSRRCATRCSARRDRLRNGPPETGLGRRRTRRSRTAW